MLPHSANPLNAELYTAALCCAQSPDHAVHSNASVNTAAVASACRGNSRVLAERDTQMSCN